MYPTSPTMLLEPTPPTTTLPEPFLYKLHNADVKDKAWRVVVKSPEENRLSNWGSANINKKKKQRKANKLARKQRRK